MAGPNELELRKALSSDPGQIRRAAASWRKAAKALGKVADELVATRTRIETEWPGGADADAATAAFTRMAHQVRIRSNDMEQGATSLDTAATALAHAKAEYAKLPPVQAAPGPMPTDPTPRQEVAHQSAIAQHDKALSDRENAAGVAVHDMNITLEHAREQMGDAAPYRDSSGGGGGGTGPQSGTTPGTSSPTVGAGSGPVGPYSTSTAGTHAGSPHGAAAALVGTPVLGGAVAASGGRPVVRGSDQGTPDGVVGGDVSNAGDTGTQEPGAAAVAGSGVHGTTAGMGVGGAAALIGGGKGLLGRAGVGGAGAAARGASGVPEESPVAGSRSAVGRNAASPVTEEVLGSRGGVAATRAGATNVTAAQRGSIAGEAARPAAATEPESGAGSRALGGGRASAAQVGSRSTSGGASGQRSSAASGQRGTGVTGRRGAGGEEDEADRRRAMIMAEDWIDEDDVAPDVIE